MTGKLLNVFLVASLVAQPSIADDTMVHSSDDCSVDQASSSQCHVHLAQLRAAALHSTGQRQGGEQQRYLLRSGDSIYLKSPSHNNDYLECHGSAGEGYG